MSKFVAIMSLGLVVLLLLGGCATQEGGRYGWLKGEEKKEAPKNPGRSDWLEARPEEEDKRAIGAEVGDIDLKLDYWMAGGEQVWSIAHYGWKISELVYPADTDFLVLTAEYRFREKWSVDASYGLGDCDKGTGTDTDWVNFGNPNPTHLATCDSTGDASFGMVDLYYRFLANDLGYLDAFLGYQQNENSFRMTNGQWVIYDSLPDTTPIPGLNSTYTMEYRGVRLGVRGETPLTRNREWTLEGSVAYLPWLEAEGKGYWNLRDMTFAQTGGEGDGIDAFVAVNYKPSRIPHLTFELGYRYMELKTSGGISRSNEAGSVWYADWDKTNCKFDGVFFGLSYRF